MTELKPECAEALREVQRLVDGELDATVRMRIESHLADCPPCLQKVEFRRHVKLVVSTKCGGEGVPADLRGRILGLIDDLEPPTR